MRNSDEQIKKCIKDVRIIMKHRLLNQSERDSFYTLLDLEDARARITDLEAENKQLRDEIEGHPQAIQDAINERLGDLRC